MSKAPYFQDIAFSLWIQERTDDFIKKWSQRPEDKSHVPPPSLPAQPLLPWRSGGSRPRTANRRHSNPLRPWPLPTAIPTSLLLVNWQMGWPHLRLYYILI